MKLPSNPASMVLMGICLFGFILFLVLWIIKMRWVKVDAMCTDCVHSQKYPYLSKGGHIRHRLAGYQSTFTYTWNSQEYTGKQKFKYNPGKYMPGAYYTIRVNPQKPHVIATRAEVGWHFAFVWICIAMIIALFVS